MIIDEILDTIEQEKILNIEYIKNQAQLFGFDDITKPILNQDKNELKTALKNYIINNNYNMEILPDIDNIKISFLDIETATAEIIEQIETTLFYTEPLKNKIIDILENIETPDFYEFYQLFNFYLHYNDHTDQTKWEIIKNYASIENINNINTDEIMNNFYNDIKNIFDGLGV